MGGSRAYIHHLLFTQELLEFILLAIHNPHHYLSLVAMVRKQMQDGRLETCTKGAAPPE